MLVDSNAAPLPDQFVRNVTSSDVRNSLQRSEEICELLRTLNSCCDLCKAIAHSVDLLPLLLTTCSADTGAVPAEVHVAQPGRHSGEFMQDIIKIG
jgi:hypothetical protein